MLIPSVLYLHILHLLIFLLSVLRSNVYAETTPEEFRILSARNPKSLTSHALHLDDDDAFSTVDTDAANSKPRLAKLTLNPKKRLRIQPPPSHVFEKRVRHLITEHDGTRHWDSSGLTLRAKQDAFDNLRLMILDMLIATDFELVKQWIPKTLRLEVPFGCTIFIDDLQVIEVTPSADPSDFQFHDGSNRSGSGETMPNRMNSSAVIDVVQLVSTGIRVGLKNVRIKLRAYSSIYFKLQPIGIGSYIEMECDNAEFSAVLQPYIRAFFNRDIMNFDQEMVLNIIDADLQFKPRLNLHFFKSWTAPLGNAALFLGLREQIRYSVQDAIVWALKELIPHVSSESARGTTKTLLRAFDDVLQNNFGVDLKLEDNFKITNSDIRLHQDYVSVSTDISLEFPEIDDWNDQDDYARSSYDFDDFSENDGFEFPSIESESEPVEWYRPSMRKLENGELDIDYYDEEYEPNYNNEYGGEFDM